MTGQGGRRILGVDPGLTRCGVGVVEVGRDGSLTLVDYAVIRTRPDSPVHLRLHGIRTGLTELVDRHRPDAVAVERVFAQHNLRTVMGTAQASGVALVLAAERGLPVALHTPSEVKAAVTGYGSADKAQVAGMVARLLRLPEPPRPADAADALALAICHAWRTHGASAPAAAPGAPGGPTPAQAAWAAAERGARRAGATSRSQP